MPWGESTCGNGYEMNMCGDGKLARGKSQSVNGSNIADIISSSILGKQVNTGIVLIFV